MTGFELITTPAGVADVVNAARSGDAYALDTEFHRERTYFPKVALVQIAWEGGLVLIDPLATSLAPLAELLTEGGVAVIHAAGQDLEVLERACGCVPHTLFDTQLAAGFVGLRTPSLASILDRELGVRLPKGDRLTDWLVRPLTKAQLAYAAADVEHLLEVHRRLSDKLRQSGRLAWAAAESEELRLRTRAQRDPEHAWLRIKEVRHLNKKARGIAQSVGRWREEKAIETDQPPRFVLPDLAVIGVAQRAPTTVAQLRKIRGLDDRHARGQRGRGNPRGGRNRTRGGDRPAAQHHPEGFRRGSPTGGDTDFGLDRPIRQGSRSRPGPARDPFGHRGTPAR